MVGTETVEPTSFDGSGAINTTGDSAYGIHILNTGTFDGTYALVTNSYTITTNVVNVQTSSISVTNFESGGSNVYTTAIPTGGVTAINKGDIHTAGSSAHGIFAESQPGSIILTFQNTTNSLAYGDAGPVNVANSGNITTIGSNSHGIFAQSQGGFGPEDSSTSGNGGGVVVSTHRGSITTAGQGSGIFAQSRQRRQYWWRKRWVGP